jgi:aminopeptidase N
MRNFANLVLLAVFSGGFGAATAAQRCEHPVDPYDSGGPLDPARAAYDVEWYDLDLTVDPADSTIAGLVEFDVTMVHSTDHIAFDLDTLLTLGAIRVVNGDSVPVDVRRCGGRVHLTLPRTWAAGEPLAFTVAYHGRPRIARRAPWDGGFVWARTKAGEPWIATANQTEGPDVWWPVKDHVSDKPDSMAISVTVPEDLVAATNGRLVGVDTLKGGWHTWHWRVSTPISAYTVALNIAPYVSIDTVIASVAGDSIPVVFYVLPDDLDRGRALFPEILAHLQWFERRFGPYPFRADKYGVAQTPHLGMEHQSIIAYGANFDNRAMTGGVDWGFDALHHHELSHEWFGNLMTNADWKDMWLHEGFGTYTQVLWLEDTQGVARSREYLRSFRPWIRGRNPVATRESATSQEIGTSNDMYFKGAWALHTLRWLIGDDAFFTSLRRLVYPTPESERTSRGEAVHFSSTAEYEALVEKLSGRDLSWFFDTYIYAVQLPALAVERRGDQLTLTWQIATVSDFPLPVEVSIDGAMRRVEMDDGSATLTIPAAAEVLVDPEGWILMEPVAAEEQ